MTRLAYVDRVGVGIGDRGKWGPQGKRGEGVQTRNRERVLIPPTYKKEDTKEKRSEQ